MDVLVTISQIIPESPYQFGRMFGTILLVLLVILIVWKIFNKQQR